MIGSLIRGACVLLVLQVVVGCDASSGRPARRRLDPIRTDKGFVGRSVLACQTGECILLHYPRRVPDHDLAMYQVLNSVREGELLPAEDVGWLAEEKSGSVATTFNCCTFAVAELLGLTAGDWVAPNSTGDTNGTVPMQIILDSYFRLIRGYNGRTLDWTAIERDATLADDDVLCFVTTQNETVEFTHVGRIHRVDGTNLLVGKLGLGPIVRAPIRATATDFEGQFDEIRIYRRKERFRGT